MRPAQVVTLVVALATVAPHRAPAAGAGHCMPYTVSPVAGDPGAFRIETARGATIARRPAPPSARHADAVTATIHVYPGWFDADHDTIGTPHDTILVAPGTVVRWVRGGPGFHTVTNGTDSGDPEAGLEYSAVFDDATTSFERTFDTPGQYDYFCYIHEPDMMGTIVVTTAVAGVVPPGPIRRALFTRPPAPNPSRGAVSFAVALPHSGRLQVTVHDIAGRTLATLADEAWPAGEHAFAWNGRSAEGRALRSGRYFIRLSADGSVETRAVSLIR